MYRDTFDYVFALQHVRYKDWNFIPSGQSEEQKGRKWLLSPHMTQSEIIQTAFKAVMTAEEHEIREAFLYRGQPIFNPHYSVEALHALCLSNAVDSRGVIPGREELPPSPSPPKLSQ